MDDDDKNQTLSGQLHIRALENLDIELFGRHTKRETDTDGFDFSGGPLQGLAIDNSSFSDTEERTARSTTAASTGAGTTSNI